ncbi:hypothetical protein ACQEVC_35450 [Plantactinospora sp. CA-294935]|uniref:hypothetical protein n=1 Tax=Plantactinospora sp. CA-294935 TaxID=3240012 RepID=UPI003D8CBB76
MDPFELLNPSLRWRRLVHDAQRHPPSFYRIRDNELLMFGTSYRKHNNEYG